MKIVEQTLDRLQKMGPGPVMVADKKVAWPAQMAIGSDGMGNSLDHIREIMGTSMEALIHHFKLVTEGFRVPAGQVFQTVEHPRGELGVHLVSDGGHAAVPRALPGPVVQQPAGDVDHVRGRAGGRRRRRRRVPRPGAGRGGPLMSIELTQPDAPDVVRRRDARAPHGGLGRRSSPATRRRARRCCRCCTSCSRRTATSARAGIAFCAAHLGLTTAEVSAVATFYTQYKRHPNGDLHGRRLHQHALRGHGRRRHLGGPVRPPRRRARRDHGRRRRSRSSASSATRPATTRRS